MQVLSNRNTTAPSALWTLARQTCRDLRVTPMIVITASNATTTIPMIRSKNVFDVPGDVAGCGFVTGVDDVGACAIGVSFGVGRMTALLTGGAPLEGY